MIEKKRLRILKNAFIVFFVFSYMVTLSGLLIRVYLCYCPGSLHFGVKDFSIPWGGSGGVPGAAAVGGPCTTTKKSPAQCRWREPARSTTENKNDVLTSAVSSGTTGQVGWQWFSGNRAVKDVQPHPASFHGCQAAGFHRDGELVIFKFNTLLGIWEGK